MSPAAVRMACVWWLQDDDAGLAPVQRIWLSTRLARATAFTPTEVARLAPALIAWGTAREAKLGQTIAVCCGSQAREAMPQQSALDILKRWPGPTMESL
jgi:hypothetical protein